MTDLLRRKLDDMVAIDLQDYSEKRLSDFGELEVGRGYSHNIYIAIGKDILELSKVSFGSEDGILSRPSITNAYIIRNLSSNEKDASIVIDDERKAVGEAAIQGMGELAVYGRSSVIIGRSSRATPGLKLSPHVGRKHMSIRFGNVVGNTHFLDLESANGTVVYVDPRDEKFIHDEHRRSYTVVGKQSKLLTEVEQRWLR